MSLKVAKPKTQRGKRFLQNRDSKIEENVKSAMLIRGGKTSELITQAMKDIYVLKKPHAAIFQRKNILRPFEDQSSLEFFSQKSDASLMLFGSHSKKRPNNLVFGCFYDGHILDMIELGVEKYIPMSNFKAKKVTSGTKPCVMFSGEEFDSKLEYQRARTLLTDFWRGGKPTNIRLQGLEHVIQITAANENIFFRSYRVVLKKSGLKAPRVELEEIGPSFDFTLRRTHLASDSLYKECLRKPKVLKPKKTKNIGHDIFGTKTGRIHMQTQDYEKLQTRKMKGLKRSRDKLLDKDKSEAISDANSKKKKAGQET